MTQFERLLIKRSKFQGFIKNSKLVYTYIAPKNEKDFGIFLSIVYNLPTTTNSLFEILSNTNKIEQILFEHFSENTELQIYVSSNDTHTSLSFNVTLEEYVKNENLEFIS